MATEAEVDLARKIWDAARRDDVHAFASLLADLTFGREAAERKACAALARNPYGDAVRASGRDEPLAVGEKIAAAIEARGK